VTQSIYSGDPRVDRQHLIFISTCHTTIIYTLLFPTFALTCSFRDFVDARYCVDLFLSSSSLMYKESEERFSQRHPLQSRCKRVPNESIPTYGHSWSQCQSELETDRTRRNGETPIGGQHTMPRVVLTPGTV
jgi:hypothetical protein